MDQQCMVASGTCPHVDNRKTPRHGNPWRGVLPVGWSAGHSRS